VINDTAFPRKIIKKAFRILVVMLLVIILLPLLIAGLLFLDPVQNKVVDWATHYVDTNFGIKTEIGSIYIGSFTELDINEILVYDMNVDTMMYASQASVELGHINMGNFGSEWNQLSLSDGGFHLYIAKGDSLTNLQHVINQIPKSEGPKTELPLVRVDQIDLSGFNFSFHNANVVPKEEGRIDFAHLQVRQIETSLKNVTWNQDTISAQICQLAFMEQSGFILRSLQSDVELGPGNVSFSQLLLATNSGLVQGDYSMKADSWSEYSNFIEKVHLDAKLYDSKIRFDDLAYFTPDLRGLLLPFTFTGEVSGTIDNLTSNVDVIEFAEQGHLSGKVKVKGLPDISNTFIDADLERLYATVDDMERINLPRGGEYRPLVLSKQLHTLDFVNYSGRYTGFVNDFVTYGNIETALGFVDVDVNIKTGKTFQYSGKVTTSRFKLGKLINAEPQIADIGFHLDVKGKGLEPRTLEVVAVGNVHHISIKGYEYKDIDIDGVFDDMIFNGFVGILDSNIKMKFNGMVDLTQDIPLLKSKAQVEYIHPGNLNLLPQDTFGAAGGEIDIILNGNSKRTLNGNITLKDFWYSNKTDSVTLDSLALNDRLIENGHDIEIQSDIVEAKVIGKTSLFDLPYAFTSVAHFYMPNIIQEITGEDVDSLQDFHFDLSVQDDPDFWHLIDPKLKVNKPVFLEGSLRTRGHSFNLEADSLSWGYDNIEVHDQHIAVHPAKNDLILNTDVRTIKLSESYSVENFNAFSAIKPDSAQTKLHWVNSNELGDSGAIELLLFRSGVNPWNAILESAVIRIAEVEWSSVSQATFMADSNRVEIEDFALKSAEGLFACSGSLNEKMPSILNFDIDNFGLNYLGNFGIIENEVQGKLSGTADLYYQNKNIIIDGGAIIDSLSIDGTDIGRVEGEARYSDQLKKVIIDANLNYLGNERIKLMGDYYPTRKSEQLDLEAAFMGFNISSIEPFVDAFASEMKGEINGSASITGTIKQPDINGGLSLKKVGAKVNYLNTSYIIDEATVLIRPDLIAMDLANVTDEKGSVALTNVQIFHDYFSDLSYDVFIQAENFLCLNTTLVNNEAYYGVANITGDINIGGYAARNIIDVEASTDKNTVLHIPLSIGGIVNEFDFIRFVSKDGFGVVKKEEALAAELKGLELNFRLAVDKDAEVQIIFDEKVGDIIKARGTGDMLLQIDNRGKFNMYGDYVIDNGEYLFTLQNVINKRFDVASGSKITWNGDVSEAKLDILADYRLKASPATMVSAMTGNPEKVEDIYYQRLPADVRLMMSGPMSTPEIEFGVSLPTLSESDIANQLISPGIASKEQITSQAFSLLLANQFSSGNGGVSLGGAGQSSGFEVLSNQLSNWASQYSDRFDVGINYRDAYSDETGETAREAGLSFSTEIGERWAVEVNGTLQGAANQNETGDVAGEFNVEYKINKDGSLKGRVYNESNNYSSANLNQSPYTQGVGLFYRKEFDTWSQFFSGIFGKGKERKSTNSKKSN
jgi:hypothetical protein